MTTRVEVKHDGKTLAFECAESETFQTFVERVREGFGTQSTSASRATFLSAGGARVAGDDVAFDFGALLRKNSRRGRLKMMMVVASAGRGERRRVAGGASRGVEALRAARAEKSAREEARREANGSSSSSIEARKTAWASTGIVGMRNAGATEMDDAVFELGERVRVVDAAGNALTSVPAAIARLTNLTRLTLRENALRGDGVPWSSFASLRALTFLDLSGNRVDSVPADAALECASLRTLSLARCGLSKRLPEAFFRSLQKLRHVSVAENALETLPAFDENEQLEIVDASRNKHIRRIPDSYAKLTHLQSLDVSGNSIDADGVPAALLRDATSLTELSLRDNPLTLESLRTRDGWDAFDARRKKRADKALESRVMLGQNVFDEGADEDRFIRH